MRTYPYRLWGNQIGIHLLSFDEIEDIREKYKSKKFSIEEIAEMYRIDKRTIKKWLKF